MGMKIHGVSAVRQMLVQDGVRATSALLRQMRREAKKISDLSAANAPVDQHNLEQAHRVVEQREGRDRSKIMVTVGGVVNGVDVDDYATEMHEGDYRLGPKSQLKQAITGRTIGPKYLERAAEERLEAIERDAEKAVRASL